MTQRTVRVRERQSTTIDSDIVAAVPQAFWRAADCTIYRAPGDGQWTITAGDSVGVSRIVTPTCDVTLTVTSKLPDVDVFFLADYAFNQRHDPLKILFDFDEPALAAVRSDPTACLLLWHVSAINRFASRWLRRDYQSVEKVFEGKVKGRILIDRYVKQHLAVGRADQIPCRTIEQTQDTPNNRILKAGLRYVAALSHALPVPAAGLAVRRQVSAALPKFALVSDITVTPSALRATSTRGPQKHYGSVLKSTSQLLDRKFIDSELGGLSTQSFMWRMPILFQEAVRGILSTFDEYGLDASAPPMASIFDNAGTHVRSSKVDPDFVLRSDGITLLDTKYKNVLLRGDPESEDGITFAGNRRIKVSRADIYQAVAYQYHERWDSAVSALLFPVTLAQHGELPPPMEVRGFGMRVPLLFIDIGPHAADNLVAFRELLGNLQGPGRSESPEAHDETDAAPGLVAR